MVSLGQDWSMYDLNWLLKMWFCQGIHMRGMVERF
jgi:hypothetical protein